ncbi:UDP-N-acetylenolpyruvoylglucosamine reductase [Ectothiorhodospira shaposhnikovii]|uniref:UDP-N-acetylmuramate dehydrogenase n=1 Tax=Ectothiorhodospira shaposhnikovii TaxID=1054 RepID=UPI0019085DD8|nr:UDP-N-acetylmuramate dehydrogenase [Ectothiorhodospira shaposhnikovii]MBK1674779.1 UDP-N-acetylenolpyruvoylglucosamine reductase [Ectothiorhodospira shaposhnikovii]
MERLTDADHRVLSEICPGGVFRDVDLARISRWRIGGRADLILQPSSGTQVAALRRWFHERAIHHVVIGMTSNLLFADEGLHVPCIQIGPRMAHMSVRGAEVTAEAGVWVPGFARRLMHAGLTGAEHTCGIPGTLGGLVCMNGGSQRKGIGTNVLKIYSVDVAGCDIHRVGAGCDFAYRQSVYQSNGEIITAVSLRFAQGERSAIRRQMLQILADRRHKFPRKEPNCGSVFKSNPAMYADIGPPGAAIERLGFKGLRVGGALVSCQHANFIVNSGSALARDVLQLIARISVEVKRATGHQMEAEACYVTTEGEIMPADQVVQSKQTP